jgi:hypothetical protein
MSTGALVAADRGLGLYNQTSPDISTSQGRKLQTSCGGQRGMIGIEHFDHGGVGVALQSATVGQELGN